MNRRLNWIQVVQVFFLALTTGALNAQVTLVADYTAHYGYVGGVDLSGYVTYDIYVSFPTSNYRLTSIGGGLQNNPNFTVQLSSDCNFFQDVSGSYYSEGINCSDYVTNPALEWDSRFAIGSNCNSSNEHLYAVTSENNSLSAWEEGSSSLILSNTLFFRMPNDGSVLLNSDNAILVGRFTTCGNLCVKLGVQYFQNYSGPGSSFQTEVLEGCFNNPCQMNPVDQVATVTQSGCSTDTQQIHLNAGGNFPVNYELWNSTSNSLVSTYSSTDGSCSFTAPSAGFFVVLSADNYGCRDTTNEIAIQEFIPPSIQLTSHDLLCFEDASGSIDVMGSGGTGVLTEVSSASQVPFILSNLSSGIHTIQVQDSNGCLASSSVTLNEPQTLSAELLQQTDLICANQCTGEIIYNVFGGTGTYNYQLLSNGQSGISAGSLSGLCGGIDTLLISDQNGCVFEMPFELDYPDSILIQSQITPPTCDEYVNGEAQLVFSGGSGALHITLSNGNYEVLPQSLLEYQLANLGIGNISVQVEDDAGCAVDETIIVQSLYPSNLNLSSTSTEESCFNNLDGTAEIILQGGNWPFNILWNDAQNQTNSVATGLAGNRNYRVRIIDANACEYIRNVFVPLRDGCIFIANAITPNGDGANDTWIIGGLDGYPNALVQVVNRYGQVVFESNGYTNPWKGTLNNEPLPPADYYYVVTYDTSKEPLTGVVSIKYE